MKLGLPLLALGGILLYSLSKNNNSTPTAQGGEEFIQASNQGALSAPPVGSSADILAQANKDIFIPGITSPILNAYAGTMFSANDLAWVDSKKLDEIARYGQMAALPGIIATTNAITGAAAVQAIKNEGGNDFVYLVGEKGYNYFVEGASSNLGQIKAYVAQFPNRAWVSTIAKTLPAGYRAYLGI